MAFILSAKSPRHWTRRTASSRPHVWPAPGFGSHPVFSANVSRACPDCQSEFWGRRTPLLDPFGRPKRPWRQRQRGWRGQMLRWVRAFLRGFDHFRAPFDRNIIAFGAFWRVFALCTWTCIYRPEKHLRTLFFSQRIAGRKSRHSGTALLTAGIGIREAAVEKREHLAGGLVRRALAGGRGT